MIDLRRSTLIAALLSSTLLGQLPAAQAQATFPVSFAASAAGLSANERAQLTSHFQAAGQRWTSLLGITAARSIEVQVEVDNSIPRFGGASFTSVFVGVEQGRDTFEQGAAAELRTGVDPNGATPDVRIIVSEPYLRNELWFDPDPQARLAAVPEDRTDAMSVAIHELGHALGYNGFANGAGEPPAEFWSTFDRWMQPGSPTLFNGPVVLQVWGSAPDLTTNNIFHWSNQPIPPGPSGALPLNPPAVQWEHGVPRPQIVCAGPASLDAPPSMAGTLGTPPPGLLSELMNGVVFFRGYRYDISALDLALMADVGLPPLGDAARIFRNGFEAP
jgi:hypothetical protein